MCGIFALFQPMSKNSLSSEDLWKLTQLLKHRGPDGGDYWSKEPFFLGHQRLSIIDLETGQQPMLSSDGRFAVTFNGEIYNYLEIRQELIDLGYVFSTASDTEVLLHGYHAFGTTLPEKLIGMFAFAIADTQEHSLFIARDRFGEKPLFYFEWQQSVVVASEVNPIMHLFREKLAFNPNALAEYLCLNFVSGHATLLHGVASLLPGHWRLYNHQGQVKTQPYWKLPLVSTPLQDNRAVIKQKLQDKLDEAVALALRSDVPVTLFLSGGIDSSLIAESAVRQGKITSAYCLDFEDPRFSEWKQAEYVAKYLGIKLNRVVLNEKIVDEFESVLQSLDMPMADSSVFPLWALAQSVSKDYKVALSGDGGDELFGGYITYKATQIHSYLSKCLPKSIKNMLSDIAEKLPTTEGKVTASYKLKRYLRAINLPASQAHFTWNGTFLPQQIAKLLPSIETENPLRVLQKKYFPQYHTDLSLLQYADVHEYLTNDILVKVDRMTMAHGLEARSPFLDYRLAEFAFTLPNHYKMTLRSQSKLILRELAADIYGHRIAYAKKQGFSIPIHQWLRGRGKDFVLDVLALKAIHHVPYLDGKEVIQLRDRFLKGESLGYEIWNLLLLVGWVNVRYKSFAVSSCKRNAHALY